MFRISPNTEFVGQIAYFDFIAESISSRVLATIGLPFHRSLSSDTITTAPSISPRLRRLRRMAVTSPPLVERSRIIGSVAYEMDCSMKCPCVDVTSASAPKFFLYASIRSNSSPGHTFTHRSQSVHAERLWTAGYSSSSNPRTPVGQIPTQEPHRWQSPPSMILASPRKARGVLSSRSSSHRRGSIKRP